MSAFAGTRTLLSFAWRRDRVLLPSWMAAYLAYTVGGTAAAVALYPSLQERLDAAAAVNEMPALVVMYGRVWDPQSLGAVSMMKPIGFGGIFAAILAILVVTRHTRTEEESGRLEMVRTQAVGTWAPLVSALLLVSIAMAVLCVVNGLGVAASGLPASSAWAFASSASLCGLTFGAVAALTAQLTQAARASNVIALALLAAAFLLRGTADAAGTADTAAWWTWLSPVGWQDQVKAFSGDHWSVLPLFVVSVLALTLGALALAGNRDHDAGLVPQRPGRPEARPTLRSPFALALRLQRGLLAGLTLSYLAMGMLLGAVVSTSTKFMESDAMRNWLETAAGTSDPLAAFMVFELGFVSLLTGVCAVLLARRLGAEEQAGRAEPLLAVAVSHNRLLTANIAVASLGATLLQAAAGFAFWFGNALQTGTYDGLGQAMARALVYLPAIWLVMAIAVAAFAFTPARSYLGWVVAVATILIAEFGPMFTWPSLVMDLSPFTHVPRMPATPMLWVPELWLSAIVVALLAATYAGFRRRDLATP